MRSQDPSDSFGYHLRVLLRTLSACALCLHFIAVAQRVPTVGAICGTLLNEHGKPSAYTGVTARYIGPHSGPYPVGNTDASGHYCITGVSFGEYVVYASDEKKGYPDLDTQFYAPWPPKPRVTLSAANSTERVDVRIPYRAGFLGIHLTESGSGKPLEAMSVSLVLRSDPEHRYMHISTSSDQDLLIPPNEDLYVNVTSPGFSTWPNGGSKGMLLSFLPGQRHALRISIRKLEPQ